MPLRHPGANERRQRRLHHRDAERGDDGAEIEHRDARPDAAQRRADRAQQQARSAARSARRAARSSASRRWRRPRTAPSAGRTGCRPAFPTGAGRSWISGMTGGTARIVRRSAMPASQSSSSARIVSDQLTSIWFQHDLVRKPVPTFRDHAQAARRRGTLATATIDSSVKAAVTKKIARGSPWSSSAANSSGARMPAMW